MSGKPTLAAHVEARHHVVADDAFVILHDTRTGRVAQIGEREWTLICCADGTRDLDGVRAAATARGRAIKAEHVAAFFGELSRAGMLSEGAPPVPAPALRPPADRPLMVLPDFALRCDGTGTCCRLYPTTAFSSLEVARARVHAPGVMDCGLAPEEVFTPEVGSTRPPWRARAVAMVDGRCAFLASTGRCVLHDAGGAAAKPRGCDHYPTSFVDDGAAVRVSVVPECACVFRSALDSALDRDPEGAPLVPPGAEQAGDLDESVYVVRLPREIQLGVGGTLASQVMASQVMVSLGDALVRALGDSTDDCDAARLWWTLAREADQGAARWLNADLEELARRVVERAGPGSSWPVAEHLLAVTAWFAEHLERRIDQDRGWRAASDLARQVPQRMRAVLPVVEERGWRLVAPQPAAEAFLVRAVLHGQLWLTAEDEPLCACLEQRAVRVLIARALAEELTAAERADEPAFDYPLALVEAVCRGLGTAPDDDLSRRAELVPQKRP